MKIRINYYALIIILLISLLSMGNVQAFSSDTLSVDILPNGDAYITFDYTLNKLEKTAVYLKIADPNTELKKALEEEFHHPVTVEEVTESSAQFKVQQFSNLTKTDGITIMSTPEISFLKAEKALQKHWFAPLVQADYSAEVATVTYPDGYTKEFFDTKIIPAINYTIQI